MKKFFATFSLLSFVGLLFFYLVFVRGIYLPNEDAEIKIPYKSAEKELLMLTEGGTYSPFEIQGVELSSFQPGRYAHQFAPTEEDYLRWLKQISEMGANSIRISDILDSDFYNALYAFNKNNDRPLYLLQSFGVRDAANYGYKTAYHEKFFGKLMKDARKAVDVIHGRSYSIFGGFYRKDVSPWVIGYQIGNDWVSDTIAYTDHHVLHSGTFAGEYFSTVEDATAFEALLAQVMEQIVSYESAKYHTQRLVGFVNSPESDFLHYQEMYARQLGKFAYLDAENILPTAQFEGYYAAYNIYDFSDEILPYLTADQLAALDSILPSVHIERSYAGYLDLLSEYHTMPVLISRYGFSSARGTTKKDTPPLTELEQGIQLIKVWKDSCAANLSGVYISGWQDQWALRSWNTIFSVDLDNNFRWHDLQSDSQNYGLMTYLPELEPVCVLDGTPNEWDEEDIAIRTDDYSISIRSDYQGLYLLLSGVREDAPAYVAFDTLENNGANYSQIPFVRFDSPADFLLVVDGKDHTQLLVHERYDAMRSNFGFEITRRNPYIDIPLRSGTRYVPIRMATRNPTLVDTNQIRDSRKVQQLRVLGTYDTGHLVHGNGNRAAENFHSLADFCFGEDCVELRIPWQLLNFYNPIEQQVHKDYYDHYGVVPKFLTNLKMGIGDGSKSILMEHVKLPNLTYNRPWREQLKQSYEYVQTHWTRSDAS